MEEQKPIKQETISRPIQLLFFKTMIATLCTVEEAGIITAEQAAVFVESHVVEVFVEDGRAAVNVIES